MPRATIVFILTLATSISLPLFLFDWMGLGTPEENHEYVQLLLFLYSATILLTFIAEKSSLLLFAQLLVCLTSLFNALAIGVIVFVFHDYLTPFITGYCLIGVIQLLQFLLAVNAMQSD